MFDRIAGRYDLLNTVLSFGADARWRRRAARAARPEGAGRVLDVACGSGRLALELRRLAPGGLVVGLDFSRRMLEVAASTAPGPRYLCGDALRLPFPEQTFEAVTVAFGLRNLADAEAGLREMLRVLRPGGRAVVLEFVRPGPGPLGRAYRAYLRHLLPRVGGWISGDAGAYRYLSDTVDAYLAPGELVELAAAAGWRDPRIELLTLGTVGLLTGRR
ncbi:MAG TPA: ubiquinone/menaquinone biosynthesis methyltransferase [Candidatus Dormibacteraeota bacterium]|nr:ubiquinone/menaquinone biosynthesis methyltransferase [Candidatus Dormibacteraeota bacterium]